MLQLISATPSPYARKVRIILQEKNIPFELITEVPWDSTTATPRHNPLEKLPILILENGSSIYESHHILEYIETKFPDTTPMLSIDVDERLFAKKVEVVCDGICDALVLLFFEKQRSEIAQSAEWKARQMRKVDGGFRTLAEWVSSNASSSAPSISGPRGLDRQGERACLVGGNFGLADVAIGCVAGYVDVRFAEYPWRERHPALAKYVDKLGARQSFKDTVPVAQKITDKIV